MSETPAAAPHQASPDADLSPASPGWLETSKEKVEKAAEQTADYVQRKPYQALAIAAGIGFVAGLILKALSKSGQVVTFKRKMVFMAAETQTQSDSDARPSTASASADHRSAAERSKAKGGLRRLLSSFTRLVDLQYRIWLTRLKMMAIRVAVSAGLLIGAAILSIMAVIFLCIGIFHVLTDVAGLPEWAAFLIFGGFLAMVALIFVIIVAKMLTRTESQDEKEGEK